MATLLSARSLRKVTASHTLFDDVSLQVSEGDRVGMIGPNGTGKSTLLRILAGLEPADDGEVIRRRNLRMAYIAQEDLFEEGATVRSALGDGEATKATILLTQLGFVNVDQRVETLSGGWRKRLAIARSLLSDPEVLLLDEPTNHLDLEGIRWLEEFVQQSRAAMVFITHDRQFLENTAGRITELSRAYPNGLLEVEGNYTEFARRRSEFLEGQASAESVLANTVRKDLKWLGRNVEARRTKNKSQIEASLGRQEELAGIRARNEAPLRATSIDFQATERKTRKLIEVSGVGKRMGDRTLFSGLDLVLSPGKRIGLLGANGSGKSTLLRVLNGDLAPDGGVVSRAANLRVVTFTQHRCSLDPEQTLREALCPLGDFVEYRGRSIHVSGWARQFLFAPTQLNTFVRHLSGGEQSRVLMARLMLEPADVLLLDEPTNDLDIPSLEVLEEALTEFPGALVLISHDRFMLEQVCTEFLALDGRGGIGMYATLGHAQRAIDRTDVEPVRETRTAPVKEAASAAVSSLSRKLSYKEQRELDGMQSAIEAAEAQVSLLQERTADPRIIADHKQLAELCRELGEAQQRVETLYARWDELERRVKG